MTRALLHFYSFTCTTATLYSLALEIFLHEKKSFAFLITELPLSKKDGQHKQERFGNNLTGWIAKMLFSDLIEYKGDMIYHQGFYVTIRLSAQLL